MRIIETEILIIGAGPAGAMAALFLAKKNISCLLVDKAVFPRDKICGDALSGKVVEVLKRYDPALIGQLVESEIQIGSYGVNFIAPNNKWLRVPFKKDYATLERAPGFVSKRIYFDNFLVEEVRKKRNIEFLENIELRIFEKTNDGYLCYDTDKSIQIKTKLIIACDGSSSAFAKHVKNFNLSNKENCFGLRAYYAGVKGLDKDNFIELHFIKELLPGYFWIFPLPNGEANIGLGIRADVVTKKKLKLPQLLEFKDRFKDATLTGKIQLHALPMGTKQRVLHGDNFLLAGDAAALIDPFTGEGIGNAMVAGLCAAETIENIHHQQNFSASSLSTYDQKIYKRLGPELQMSSNLQKLVMYPRLFNYVVNKATNNTELQNLISTMFEDIDLRAKFKDPKFYFKLLFN